MNLNDISNTSWVIANFLLKFTNFCYHGNKGGLAKIWMTAFDKPSKANPKTPSLVQNSGTYVKCELNYCDVLCGNFHIFVTMATGVDLAQISLTQLNRKTPKTPYLAQESRWYLIYQLSCSRFSDEIYQFSLPWQQEWVLRKFKWLHLIGRPPKPSVWCNILGPILNASWVMVNFVWKFPNFRFHGNRG